jgi:hypothetical protein
MDLKRDTRAKEEQITLVRNRLERLKLEEQKVSTPCFLLFFTQVSALFSRADLVQLLKKTDETNRRAEEILVCNMHPRAR